ncbi:MAG: hypothetical protein IJ836_04005 [Spirochaetales bacterium]|nr:hypothetical protein [Spirochaetales bacterium]
MNWHLLNFGSYKKDFPEEDQDKEMFLFTFKEYHPIKGPRGTEFDIAYETIEDMIDDGWAVD